MVSPQISAQLANIRCYNWKRFMYLFKCLIIAVIFLITTFEAEMADPGKQCVCACIYSRKHCMMQNSWHLLVMELYTNWNFCCLLHWIFFYPGLLNIINYVFSFIAKLFVTTSLSVGNVCMQIFSPIWINSVQMQNFEWTVYTTCQTQGPTHSA